MKDLAAHIGKYILLNEPDLQAILSRFRQRDLKKGRYLLKSGQTSQDFMFIQTGCLRVFSEGESGEVTGWFAFEGEFFCELSSFLPQTPSKFSVQALEDTALYYLTRADLEQLYCDFPVWQELMRKFWEQIIAHMVGHIVSFQTETAEARYQRALKHPQLMQRVPLKYLASYLGVTPTSLSRLRKRK
ncbi:MAG: Crp/Fnr family transcriptional regulator [Saprospiraceae bacterium]